MKKEAKLADSVKYSVIFKNESTNSGNICLFQKDPDIGVTDVMSLAWFSKYVYPSTNVTFDWEIDYNFVWSETGELVPGVIFHASQSPDANLTDSNAITLSHDKAYHFKNQSSKTPQGSLYIQEDSTIPLKMASVGIGMSGCGTFVVQAQPNMNLTFTPHPEYWIAFGNYNQGQVLDIQEMTNDVQIKFPNGIYTMVATLKADNTWSVVPLSEANADMLKKK